MKRVIAIIRRTLTSAVRPCDLLGAPNGSAVRVHRAIYYNDPDPAD